VAHYRRDLVPGAAFFFTVALVDRRSSRLTTHIAALREALRTVRSGRDPGDWAYSPLHLFIRRGVLNADWGGGGGGDFGEPHASR
jgi:hypothetical protein